MIVAGRLLQGLANRPSNELPDPGEQQGGDRGGMKKDRLPIRQHYDDQKFFLRNTLQYFT